jgi:hypothetical protein
MIPDDDDDIPGGDELSIRGDLATTTVPDLLRTFLQNRETGRLVCRAVGVEKQVFLQEGRIVFATSTDPDERLGENLLVRGRLTARHYVEASRMIRPGRKLGVILVDLKALDPDDLMSAVESQVKDILHELCSWNHGEYQLIVSPGRRARGGSGRGTRHGRDDPRAGDARRDATRDGFRTGAPGVAANTATAEGRVTARRVTPAAA